MDASTLQNYFQKASEAFHQKNFAEAEKYFKEFLKYIPRQAEVLDALGLVYFSQGDFLKAEEYFELALSSSSNFALAHNHLGSAAFQLGKMDKAAESYQQAILLDSQLAEAYYNLAVCYDKKNELESAIQFYQKEIELKKLQASSFRNLGLLYYKQKKYALAAQCFESEWQRNPQDSELGLLLATCLQLSLSYEEALKVLNSLPFQSETLCAKAHLLQEMGKFDESLQLYQTIEGKCSREEYFVYYARLLFQLGFSELGEMKIQEGLLLFPQSLELRVADYFNLPIIYNNQNQISYFRNKFKEGLKHLTEDLNLQKISAPVLLEILQRRETFFLAYQGENDCSLQKQYAQLYCDLIQRVEKDNLDLKNNSKSSHSKIHLAFLSPHFNEHSISHTTFGFLRYLNKEHFKIHLYFIGPEKEDAMTLELKKHSEVFHYLAPNLAQIKSALAQDEIDILFLADVGMDPITQNLAMHRLALIQCTTQGHPVTTGSPHMDYFFSAADMERTAGAQDDYSEQLILLSGQGMAYPQIENKNNKQKNKKDFGLNENAFVYLACQSLYKYTPEFDWIYPEILKRVPQAQVVFVGHSSKNVNDVFIQRLKSCFEKAKVEFDSRLILLPRLSRSDFFDLLQSVDVYLDGLPWSGNNTTLEALALGELPVVTSPGKQMRHRHSAAHLKKIGAEEGICLSLEDYIHCAVKLAEDSVFYLRFKEKILQRKNELFEDKKPVEEMGRFLRSAYLQLLQIS